MGSPVVQLTMIREFLLDPAAQAAWVVAIATVVVAIATITNIFLSWSAARTYRRISRQVEGQIGIARRQADQTQQQIELGRQQGELAQKAFESLSKSYIFLELTDARPQSAPMYSARLKVTNIGNVPAESLSVRVEVVQATRICPISPEMAGPIVIVPRAEQTIPLVWQFDRGLLKPPNQILMFVRVSYKDPSGEHELKKTYEWSYDIGEFIIVREDDHV